MNRVRRYAAPVVALCLASACASLPIREVDENPLGPPASDIGPDDGGGAAIGSAGVGDPYFPGLGNGGYDVAHYDIDLAWSDQDGSIEATTTVRATATQDLARFNLDFRSLDVLSVSVNGEVADYATEDAELVVTPASPIGLADEFEVDVAYAGVPEPITESPDLFDLGWNSDLEDRAAYVVSEPAGAATWFPSNDHPSDKATYSIRLDVPDGLVGAANGTLVSETATENENGGRTVFEWEMNDPMASYLATVVIGDYEIVSTLGPSGVPIRNLFPAGLPEAARAAFDRTDEMISELAAVFGPYPFDTYGVAVATDDLFFALENQTLSIFGPSLTDESVVVHELAHQWFGDSVSPASWNDIWLNEGFATYVEWLWNEIDGGPPAADRARLEISSKGDRLDAPPGDPGASGMFGASVYIRGALTLQALRETVGDQDFFLILRTWIERFEGDAASTDDFIGLSEDVAGRQLDELFMLWLSSDTLPELPIGD